MNYLKKVSADVLAGQRVPKGPHMGYVPLQVWDEIVLRLERLAKCEVALKEIANIPTHMRVGCGANRGIHIARAVLEKSQRKTE